MLKDKILKSEWLNDGELRLIRTMFKPIETEENEKSIFETYIIEGRKFILEVTKYPRLVRGVQYYFFHDQLKEVLWTRQNLKEKQTWN